MTQAALGKIAFEIGSDWLRFGRELNLEAAELDNIDSDKKKVADKAAEALTIWLQKNKNGGWKQLKKHLESFQRYDIIRMVEDKFKSV